MRDELRTYRENGGGAVVEVTNYGIRRNAALLADYSRDTAVAIVAGTGQESGEARDYGGHRTGDIQAEGTGQKSRLCRS